VLEVTDLVVEVAGARRHDPGVRLVDGVSLRIDGGETVALVGESGAGKTMIALAVMQLLPPRVHITGGSIRLDGTELVGASTEVVRAARGSRMAMVFQDPMSSLHPAYRVGDQVAEVLTAHDVLPDRRAARDRAVELLASVGIPDAPSRAREYPHQLSGGMRQRVMIAMAIADDPHLLIADEATTALDVTVQAQVLDVLSAAQRRTGAGMLVVTHDLGVVAGLADRVVVCYSGRIVEEGPVDTVLRAPRHPYTEGLLAAVPRLDPDAPAPVPIPGQPPDPAARPVGCAFRDRCPEADAECATTRPELTVGGSDHRVACHHPVGGR
jgi:ABC-type dipeptide/oligopeptide/nickel transport system ATPase component